jgi:hypothetical protein
VLKVLKVLVHTKELRALQDHKELKVVLGL